MNMILTSSVQQGSRRDQVGDKRCDLCFRGSHDQDGLEMVQQDGYREESQMFRRLICSKFILAGCALSCGKQLTLRLVKQGEARVLFGAHAAK